MNCSNASIPDEYTWPPLTAFLVDVPCDTTGVRTFLAAQFALGSRSHPTFRRPREDTPMIEKCQGFC